MSSSSFPSASSRSPRSSSADALLELAVEVARDAGRLLLEYAQGTVTAVATKTTDTDPVTEADRASEALITQRLIAERPDDGIVGEEAAADRKGTSGLRWVIDPLDGTVNYLYGIPLWCVSIACEDGDGALVGVVYDPSRDEVFAGVRGGGARWDGRAMRVNDRTLERALVGTGFSYEPAVRIEQGHLAAAILGATRDLRRAGAAALDLAWVACGRLDGFYEFDLKPWDWSAGMLLVTEAGGVASRRTVHVAGADRDAVFAGSRPVHDGLVALVARWAGEPPRTANLHG